MEVKIVPVSGDGETCATRAASSEQRKRLPRGMDGASPRN